MAEYLQIRSNGEITLLATILRKANLKEGDLLEAIVESDGSIRLLLKIPVQKLTEKQQLRDVSWAKTQKRKKAGKK
jgi:bifunctional DNA-binding transcriptional regulator/antitoxin component of YhaV-PrlF toxin-antitoxin module